MAEYRVGPKETLRFNRDTEVNCGVHPTYQTENLAWLRTQKKEKQKKKTKTTKTKQKQIPPPPSPPPPKKKPKKRSNR